MGLVKHKILHQLKMCAKFNWNYTGVSWEHENEKVYNDNDGNTIDIDDNWQQTEFDQICMTIFFNGTLFGRNFIFYL